MVDKSSEDETVKTDFGIVGGEFDLESAKGSVRHLTSQVIGGEINIDPEKSDLSLDGYAGVSFSGDWKVGMRGEYNLYTKEAENEGDASFEIDAVGDLMYATRAGGIVSSLALQAEAKLMEGQLQLKGSAGYIQAPDDKESGLYGQVRADYKFSKDECTGFLEKGCLTNIAQATFGPDEGYEFRNEFLHDITIQGVDLGLRVGPSLEYDSETQKIDPGIAMRVGFEF